MAEMKVVKKKQNKINSTDLNLLVESTTQEEIFEYDKNRIIQALQEEIDCSKTIANKVADIVTERLKATNTQTLTPSLIRSFVNVVLCENGYDKQLQSNSEITMSTRDVESLIFNKNKENGNTPHNPESINLALAGLIIKQYTLKKILPKHLRQSHLNGDIHIHDMDMYNRLYCSGHNPEYIKRNGIKNMDNIPNDSKPANSAWVVARHMASATLFYTSLFAGAIGWDSVNVFLAPYTRDWDYKKYKQLAQTLIFDFAQLAGAKGGQVSFTDFNIYANVPQFYKNTYAVGKNGCYIVETNLGEFYYFYNRKEAEEFAYDNNFKILTYKDFEYESQQICKALLEVSKEGDSRGMPFGFPKLHFHVNDEVFNHESSKELYEYACEVLSSQGNPYIDFDRNAASMSQCCFDGNQEVLVKNPIEGVRITTFKELYDSNYDRNKTNLTIFNNGYWSAGRVVKLPRCNKDMYEIITSNNKKIILTEDHINPTLRGDLKTNQITNEDYLLFNNIESCIVKERNLNLTYEQGILIGAYLGDGSKSINPNHNHIDFSLNKEKYEYLKDKINKALKDCESDCELLLNKEYNNVYPCYVCDKKIKNFIETWVYGRYCHEKSLNLECLAQSKEFRKGIIDGYYITDGGNNNRIYTTSNILVKQMEVLFNSLGIPTIIDFVDRTNEKVIIREQEYNRNYPLYCIRWYNLQTKKVKDIYQINKNGLYFKIKSIRKIDDYNEDFVYCFEMKDENDPYFTLPNGIHTHNCRLVIEFDNSDMELTKTPEELRFVGGENVSINLPNIPLMCGKDEELIYNEIKRRMDMAVEAHIIKLKYIKSIVEVDSSPLKFYKEGCDGKPYVNFDKISWLIGMVGLNEYVYNLTGKQLHESKASYLKGLELISFMNQYCKELSKKYNMKFTLEETPAESTAGRFAKLDRKKYGENTFVKENDYGFYYSNSIHFAVDAKIDYIDELQYQSKFHTLVDAGSMIHVWVGDKKPSPQAISDLIYKVWKHTKCTEMTISPNKTVCNNCKTTVDGFHEICPKCNSENIFWIARITGYQVRVDKFNSSKLAELFDRNNHDINSDNLSFNFLKNDIKDDGKIKIYSLPNCPNCRKMKTYCKNNNISFIELNVNDNFKAKARIIAEGLENFPIIQIGNILMEYSYEKDSKIKDQIKEYNNCLNQ